MVGNKRIKSSITETYCGELKIQDCVLSLPIHFMVQWYLIRIKICQTKLFRVVPWEEPEAEKDNCWGREGSILEKLLISISNNILFALKLDLLLHHFLLEDLPRVLQLFFPFHLQIQFLFEQRDAFYITNSK